jgi:hypothetical protein
MIFNMHKLLYDLLVKRGIKNISELEAEERRDYENWQAVLSKEELNLEDIKQFCNTQCDIIKQKWSDYNIAEAKKAELIPYFTFYNMLLTAIDSPKTGREALEKRLIELIKQ